MFIMSTFAVCNPVSVGRLGTGGEHCAVQIWSPSSVEIWTLGHWPLVGHLTAQWFTTQMLSTQQTPPAPGHSVTTQGCAESRVNTTCNPQEWMFCWQVFAHHHSPSTICSVIFYTHFPSFSSQINTLSMDIAGISITVKLYRIRAQLTMRLHHVCTAHGKGKDFV